LQVPDGQHAVAGTQQHESPTGTNSLKHEALHGNRIRQQFRATHFHRDLSARCDLQRSIDNALPAAMQLLQERVARKLQIESHTIRKMESPPDCALPAQALIIRPRLPTILRGEAGPVDASNRANEPLMKRSPA